MKLSSEAGPHGNALRVDFRFTKGGGYAVLHRQLNLDLPENYRFELQMKGATQPQNFEFKLIDSSGENVWWRNQVNFEYPAEWTTERIRKRNITFAWGPHPADHPTHVAALELAITAGSGGEGTVWFDELTLVPLPPVGEPGPIVASASTASNLAEFAVDGSPGTWWESFPNDKAPSLTLDLGGSREFSGLVIDWHQNMRTGYVVELDDGDGRWRPSRPTDIVAEWRGNGRRDWLEMPESEAQRVRIRSVPGTSIAIVDVQVEDLDWAATHDQFLSHVAKESPRGEYPRGFLGEQSYWTVVGVDGDPDEGLLDEDLRLETGKGQFSIEPLLRADRLYTWADGRTEQSLAAGFLPIPTALRTVDSLSLSVVTFARGQPGNSELVASYRVRNLASETRIGDLFLALRPLPVNPPSQGLNMPGAAGRIQSLERIENRVRVNGNRWMACTPTPDGLEPVRTRDASLIEDLNARFFVVGLNAVTDSSGRASAALYWHFQLSPGTVREVDVRIPFHGEGATAEPFDSVLVARWQSDEERAWRQKLGTFSLSGNAVVDDVAKTVEAQLGYVLVNRDGPGIQPGSRSYERSWIRDGSLTSTALLHSGMFEPVREYLEWYAPHQYDDGKVPCCVDRRGSDPVPENDSHGEFIYLAAEYLRITHDAATVENLWPHIRAAVAYMDTLRAQRRTAEWRTPANAPYFGLLPPSISHEGYSAKPMHSYWDDLFALRGYKDGAWLAQQLGHAYDARWIAASRDTFARDFAAAASAAIRAHAIHYVPGCSDLGDFDPTSTTIALFPVQASGVLPRSALETTFERYWQFFQRRRSGEEKWVDYTPYELRNVGAFVALGWRERADSALRWFMGDRRPAGWRQWAEVVDHDPRHARFIGDMPHTWVGTDFVRSVQSMLAYERESDSALVIAAGVPASWFVDSALTVRGLYTRWGAIGYRLSRVGNRVRLNLDVAGLRAPPGGLVLSPPRGTMLSNPLRVSRGTGGRPIVVEWPLPPD